MSKRNLTREERRRKSERVLTALTYLCFALLLLVWLAGYLVMTSQAAPPQADAPPLLPCSIPDAPEEPENELIEQALLDKSTKIGNVMVTHYCICEKCCGKAPVHPAYGITASGRRATPGVSVGVDPDVIPLGSDVLVDYGDGEIHYYRADDAGSGISGNHIDLCVGSHQEALELGVKKATVYVAEVG